MDPMVLFGSEAVIREAVARTLAGAGSRRHILNVGHGVVQVNARSHDQSRHSALCSNLLAHTNEDLLVAPRAASAQGTPEENVGLFCQLAHESGNAARKVEEEPVLVA
jgi:Uroporphyrinogen decarboxylase (URO-D)